MTDKPFLLPEFHEWINEHSDADPVKLRLKNFRNDVFDVGDAITQIECRKRFGKKLASTLSAFPRFYFPSILSGEQCTGDLAAAFHETFVNADDSVVDLTAGLGIDAMHLARKAKKVTAVERHEKYTEALEYNARGLGIDNLVTMTGDCRELLPELSGTVAFIDPARRADDGSRLFGLADCDPDVLEMMPSIQKNFGRLIIKASPMIDISRTIADIPQATDIYIVGTQTECKELDVLASFGSASVAEPRIHAVTLSNDFAPVVFSFTRNEEAEATAVINPKAVTTDDVLYVPYPSPMKAAPVKLLSARFGVTKFHGNTHLYYGPKNAVATDFPGEILEIVEVIPWQSKNIKRLKNSYPHLSVTARNFGMTADALRNKLGVKEGGKTQLRLFGIGLGNDHTDRILLIARKPL